MIWTSPVVGVVLVTVLAMVSPGIALLSPPSVGPSAAIVLVPDGPGRLEFLQDVSADGQSALIGRYTPDERHGGSVLGYNLVDVEGSAVHLLPDGSNTGFSAGSGELSVVQIGSGPPKAVSAISS